MNIKLFMGVQKPENETKASFVSTGWGPKGQLWLPSTQAACQAAWREFASVSVSSSLRAPMHASGRTVFLPH